MRLLLDTHAIIWFYRGDASRLSATARRAMESEDNEIIGITCTTTKRPKELILWTRSW